MAHGLVVQGVGKTKTSHLRPTFETAMIPDSRTEVATPKMVERHRHILGYSGHFQNGDWGAPVLMLIGRDCGDVMYTKHYGAHYPYVHHTSLGWAVVGSVCSGELGDQAKEFVALRTAINHHFSASVGFPRSQTFVGKYPKALGERVFSI